jgi:hypothetical protein
MKAVIALSIIASAMTSITPAQSTVFTGSSRTINEGMRPSKPNEMLPDGLLLIRVRPSTPEAQFDPPRCVSGADTYCQPIGSSPPPARLPANVPQ